jgi:hypothetical protein
MKWMRIFQMSMLAAMGVVVLVTGCAPSHAGRTVGGGVLQVEGGLGGPFVTNLDAPIPVPNIPMGARFGLRENLDVAGHINVLPLIMGGFLAADASFTWALVAHEGEKGLNLATSSGLAVLTDFENGARVSPLVDIAVSYTYLWVTPFVGFETIVDLWASGAITNPFVGFEVDIDSWTLSASGIWYHPAHDWYASSIRYLAPNYQGSIGVMLGIKRRWDLMKGGLDR